MKITPRKGISKRTWLIIIAALALVVIGGAVYAWYSRSKPSESTSNVNTNPPTQEEKDAGNAAKKDTVDTPPAQTTPPPRSGSGKTNVAVTISAATQTDTTVQIRGLISTVVDSTGNCTLTLTKGASTVTKTAGTQALANSTTCQGFNIDTSELSAGDWQITLKYESNTLSGTATGTVTVR